MTEHVHLVFDFDNTFVEGESLDELVRHAASQRADRDDLMRRFTAITDAGMQGELPYAESLEQRMALLDATREDVAAVAATLCGLVTESFRRNKAFLRDRAERVWVVSGGFRDLIEPVVREYGVTPARLFANAFAYDDAGRVSGIDRSCPLAANGGKVRVVRDLALDGEVWVVGDGYTDYEIRAAGEATRFFAFTEHVARNRVVPLADHVARSLDDVIALLPRP